MKPTLKWQPHRYGCGYTAQIVKGLSLTISYGSERNDTAPYSFSGLGIISKAKFKTANEAMIAAELYARATLAEAMKIFLDHFRII